MKTILKKIFFSAVIVYSIAGFLIVPYLIKTKVIGIADKQINGHIELRSAYFNPYSFRLTLNDLKLISPKNKTIFSVEKFSANIELYSLLMGNIHFRDIEINTPRLDVVYTKEKKLNLLSIAKGPDKKTSSPSSKPPRIMLDKISITDGSVRYEDYTGSAPYDVSVNDLQFVIRDIDTGDNNSTNKSTSTSVFRAELNDGAYIKITNSIKSISPFVADGSFEFEASRLYTQWKYLKDKLNIEVADGKVSIGSKYHVDLDDLTDLKIYDAAVNVSKLRVKPKNENFDILNVKSLKIEGISAMPLKQKAHISSLSLSGLNAKLQRIGEAKIDWQDYLKYSGDNNQTAGENKKESTASPFDLTIDDIDIKDFKVSLQDKYIIPNVTTTLDKFYLHIKNATTLGTTPLQYQLITQINNGFDCTAEGSLTMKKLDLFSSLNCSGLNLVQFRPYIDDAAKKSLKKYDLKLDSAVVNFDSKVDVKDENSSVNVKISDADFALKSLGISKKTTGERLFSLHEFNLKNISADTDKSSIEIASSSIIEPKIFLSRYKNGIVNIDKIVVPKAVKQAKKKDHGVQKDWRVLVKGFDIKDANVRFEDKTLAKPAKTSVDKIYFHAGNIDSKKWSWLNYDLSAKINNSGRIKANGKLRHTPLKQRGSIDIAKLSLKFLNPYIDEYTYMKLDDGYFGFKAKERFSPSKKSADLVVNGSLSIDELFINDTQNNSSLISFNKLSIPAYTFEYAPDRLYVDKAVLDSFYVDAVIDQNKTINFAKLSKVKPSDENLSVKNDTNQTQKNSFPIRIMDVTIKNGSAKFADLSLPLKFQTNIHDLNGKVYGISNQLVETSYIDLDGIVDAYGSAKINGSINAANPKLFTDMSVVFRNLDLSNLSPYSANFAGYKIDEGKLFLDLGYKIDNSKLDASNSIIIKKIKLGDTIKDDKITVLPLGFAIALLEDNDGVIDIDMPIKGDMNNPDFKYGALVWKTLGGLITKAVTAPFRLLGSMLGIDGEKLEAIDFEAGKTVLLPPEREKLDNLAKALNKRSKLRLMISGTYDDAADKKALQVAKLIEQVVKKSGITNEDEKRNALTAEMLEDIYKKYVKEDKLDEIRSKLEKEYTDKEQFKQKYLSRLVDIDSSFMTVSEDDVKKLADARAKTIRDYLIINHHLDETRVKFDAIKQTEITDKWIKTKLDVNVK
ncbi:DUF748 domain-containing protein [Sulfurimonas sp. HSL-1716]|uniref:DUF748 domain-containing protein n=1 Tax=Hydrocurvibacter sulfurireducens TaxID=3131937 RepID=UPI0031F86D09